MYVFINTIPKIAKRESIPHIYKLNFTQKKNKIVLF